MAVPKKTMFSTGTRSEGGLSLFGEPIPDSSMIDPDKKTLSESGRYKVKYIKRDLLIDNDKNTFNVERIEMLKQSIKRLGQLQPLVVVPEIAEGKPTGKYIIRSGSRRFASLNAICEEALKENDDKLFKRFNEVLVLVLPAGATEKEIQEVIVETNTTARQIPISDLFKNYDIVFAKDEDGAYKNIKAGSNKYKAGSEILKDMGFSYSPASVKDYLTIYEAHNKTISSYLENEILSKNEAVMVARMDKETQDKVMQEIKSLSKEEIKPYLRKVKNILKENKEKNVKYIRGADVLSVATKIKNKAVKSLYDEGNYLFADKRQKDQCMTEVLELINYLNKVKKHIEETYTFEDED